MAQQAILDFPVHQFENNIESQKHLDENKPRYSKQCRELLEVLKTGAKVTSTWARDNLQIEHLARRILDLKEAGIRIESNRIAGGFSEYFLTLD